MGSRVNRRNGQNYSDNVIDELLAFDRAQTWSVTSGTGSVVRDDVLFYKGSGSLQLFNTAPTTDLVGTNTAQSTIIRQTGNYGLSMYLYKTEALQFMTLEVNVFLNEALYNTQTFVLGSETAEDDINQKWARFDTFIDYEFETDDEVTFTFTLKGKAGTALLNTSVWVDGLMLYNKDRLNVMPPGYVPPIYNRTLQSPAPIVDNLTAESYGLSELNTAPASASDTGTEGEIRITADYIYICIDTDEWVRTALTTW